MIEPVLAKYSMKWDDTLLIQADERFRARSSSRIVRTLLKAICFVGLGLLMVLLFKSGSFGGVVLLAPFMALLLAGSRIDYWLMKRNLRKSPFYGKAFTTTVQPDGFRTVGDLSTVELKWSVYARAVRFPDGILLIDQQKSSLWWPTSSIVEGSADEVWAVLEQNLST